MPKPEILAFSENTGTRITLALTNLPQLVLALLYLAYNGIVTSMFATSDYSKFAFTPMYLVVSTPCGKQRGTWLFGFPLPWALLALALQNILHWFVSQFFFVVQVSVYNEHGTLDTNY